MCHQLACIGLLTFVPSGQCHCYMSGLKCDGGVRCLSWQRPLGIVFLQGGAGLALLCPESVVLTTAQLSVAYKD